MCSLMIRRAAGMLILFLVLCCGIAPYPRAAVGAAGGAHISSLSCSTPVDHPAKFSYGTTEVLVCSSTVQSGSQLNLVILTKRLATIHIQLLFPDGTSAVLDAVADKLGNAKLTLPIHYNPITRYARAQLLVTVTRPGHTEVVPGSVTIVQAIPLASTRLFARPADVLTWCPADRTSCSIRNNSNLIIRVDSDPGAQVAVTLSYPDGESIPCPSSFTSATGTYRCQLPVVYQAKDTTSQGSALSIVAQVSAGGYTQTRSLRMSLVGH
ncbi:MAG: hypothetical protein JWO42_2090 [Chloroflexi bacterium]|jgi:hypothetical protein|nr:hypothetical protein [Chloroflexota bacterium]